jgi:hypothetical protein
MKKRAPLWLKAIAIAVILFYLVLMLATVANYANATPVSDEWHELMNSSIAIKTARGTLTWDDLTVNHMGHNLIVPRLLTALNTLLFHYDPRFEMLISIALLWLIFAALAWFARQLFAQKSPRLFWFSLIVLASLVFSARWLIGWSWGLLVSTPYVIFLTVIGILLAVRMRLGWRLAVILAVICLLALPASSASLLTCGVISAVWWLRGERNPMRLGLLATVTAIGLAMVLLSERHAANPLTFSPINLAYFVGVHLGSAQLVPPMPRGEVLPDLFEGFSIIIAALGALLCAVNFRKVRSNIGNGNLYPILAFGLFSIGFSLVVGLDRAALYPRAILLDHHTPFQNLFWVSVSLLSLAVLRNKVNLFIRTANFLFLTFICAAQATFLLISTAYAFTPIMALDDITRIRDCPLASLIGASNCLLYMTIEHEMIEQSAYGLAAHQLGPFRAVAQQPVALPLHFVSLFYDQMPTAADNEHEVSRPLILNGQAQYVLFQQTAHQLQSLSLPDLPDYRFTLRGALTADPACADQGIRARLIADDGQTQRVVVERVATTELTPFALDLTDWRGRDFSLLYELDIAEPLTCGHVLWANPRIEFSLKNDAK